MRHTRSLALVTLSSALCLAPTANAAHPKFKDKAIVVGKSIAGVKLGSSAAKAKAAWGASNADCDATICLFRVKGAVSGDRGEGIFTLDAGKKVSGVTITAPLAAKSGHDLTAPFTSPKTAKGIGIGSTQAELKRAYPKATSPSDGYFVIKGAGGVQTIFQVGAPGKRVFKIDIQIVPQD